MPANLSPEYKAAELHYRQARDPKERLQWLREMLRVIPKHKGTDHLQGDIKRRIKTLSEEVGGSNRHGGARSAPPSSASAAVPLPGAPPKSLNWYKPGYPARPLIPPPRSRSAGTESVNKGG